MEKETAVYEPIDRDIIKDKIFEVRGYRAMFYSDVAEYFCVTNGILNRAMKYNIKRFQQSFCF